MRKAEQLTINEEVKKIMEAALKEDHLKSKQLRSCSATVYTTENYYILRSYSTIIAAIDRKTDTLVDFLRLVYGYTATSAKHISKFNHDYCTGKWSCERVLTYREV